MTPDSCHDDFDSRAIFLIVGDAFQCPEQVKAPNSLSSIAKMLVFAAQKRIQYPGVIVVCMIIRQYQDDDLESVVDLFTDTVRQVNIRDYSSEQVAAWAPQPPNLARWRERIAGLSFWVAESENGIIGFCGLGANGYIDFLYVSSRFQRCGVGRHLFEHVAAEARREGACRLTTNASITARPFFESMGFKVVREQQVELQNVSLRNYHMERLIDEG